jgi:hypothetical protein
MIFDRWRGEQSVGGVAGCGGRWSVAGEANVLKGERGGDGPEARLRGEGEGGNRPVERMRKIREL